MRSNDATRSSLHQKRRKTTLQHLPSEIIFEIAKHIFLDDDLCYFARTCRFSFGLLNSELYKRSSKRDNFAILWAAKTGLTATVERALREGANSNVTATGLAQLVGDVSSHRGPRPPTFSLVQMCHGMPEKTPLVLAAENGHGDIVRLLLQDPSTIISGSDAVRAAVLNGHASMVTLLLSHETIRRDHYDQQNEMLLHLAAGKGRAEVVSVLLSRTNVKVGATDPSGMAALHLAAKNGHAETVKVLLEHLETDINLKDGRGNTPLHLAIRGRHMLVAKALTDHNDVDVNIKDRHGLRSLHLIAGTDLG